MTESAKSLVAAGYYLRSGMHWGHDSGIGYVTSVDPAQATRYDTKEQAEEAAAKVNRTYGRGTWEVRRVHELV